MKLRTITKVEFSLWGKYRQSLYSGLDNETNIKEMKSFIDDKNWLCKFIENNDDKPIGFIEMSLRNIVDSCLSSPVPYLEGFYLVEDERNKRQGEKIIQLLISWCEENGYSEFATDTELKNEQAQRFYERVGFKEVDRVVEYKFEIKKT